MRWPIAFLVACSGASTHTEPVATRPSLDAGMTAPRDSAPRPDPVPRGPIVVTGSDPCGFILDNVYFPSGSPIGAAHQQPVLDSTAEMFVCLEKLGTHSFWEVQGHADALEPNALQLSDIRAAWVRDELVKRGVPPISLRVQGHGAAQPIDRRATEAARAKNRRVSFVNLGPRP